MYAFIRHGQTEYNRELRLQGSSDIPLNDTGRLQAHEAARMLHDGGWSAIVSSPLLRARETAEIIAAGLGIELGPSYEDLRERDYGELEGMVEADAEARWPRKSHPSVESLDSVASRGRAALDRIAEDWGDRNVVIVCHGTLIRYTLASLAGHPIDSIHNGSISTFERRDGVWTVLTVNGAPLGVPTGEGAAP